MWVKGPSREEVCFRERGCVGKGAVWRRGGMSVRSLRGGQGVCGGRPVLGRGLHGWEEVYG